MTALSVEEARKQLDRTLTDVGESIDFVVQGGLAPVLPGLNVDGVGGVGLPVSDQQAQQLIDLAERAPFGYGSDTIVDLDVRRTWQIRPEALRFGNPAWSGLIDTIVAEVAVGFGLASSVDCELHKLLVYEPGDFFRPHRDTEKGEGMFATLVVELPSDYQGGALVVCHDGETRQHGGCGSPWEIRYCAFYADCQHHVEPVVSGHRICLVYNLLLSDQTVSGDAPNVSSLVAQISGLLPACLLDEPRAKLAIPLAHLYSEAGMTAAMLKGRDRATFGILSRAAAMANCRLHLALLTMWECGDADMSSCYSGYGGRYDEPDLEDAEIDEIFDESISLDHWQSIDGRAFDYGELTIAVDDILSDEDKEAWFDHQDVREATGNAGATVERWYRRAVFVVWSNDRHYEILAERGPAGLLPALEEDVERGGDDSARIVDTMIATWQHARLNNGVDDGHTGRVLTALDRLGDADLVCRFCSQILPTAADGSEASAVAKMATRHGWDWLAPALHAWGTGLAADSRTAIALPALRAAAALLRPDDSIELYEAACQPFLSTALKVIREQDVARTAVKRQRSDNPREDAILLLYEMEELGDIGWHGRYDLDGESIPERLDYPQLAIRAAVEFGMVAEIDGYLQHMFAHETAYDLRTVLVPSLDVLRGSANARVTEHVAFATLRDHCRARLQAETAMPPAKPEDWAIPIDKPPCRCADCKMLIAFLRDPGTEVARFPLAEPRRQHLHQIIDQHGFDVDHETLRRGRPYTLVCTKNRRTYKRLVARYRSDRKTLTALQSY